MTTPPPTVWPIRTRVLSLARPLVMGIVNATPDSFSDGGRYDAVDRAMQLVDEGADILDIGGESTRPGAEPVSLDEELRRVVTVVTTLAKRTALPISIDTMKPAVARACLDAGAEIVNDVTGLSDPAMVELVRTTGAGAVVVHMQGAPATMQLNPRYDDVVSEIHSYFAARLRNLAKSSIDVNRVVLDPGIGFGKTREHNLRLLAKLARFRRHGRPILLGVSRKGFLGSLLDRPVHERMAAGLAAACYCIVRGAVQIIRAHDVAATRDAIITLDAIRQHE